MELKELTSKVIELLKIESPEQIPDSLMEIVLNGKMEYFDRFCNLVEDLSIDWLQKIFQYYLADRKLQMWKQHIMYLNNEENRYLVELRDALLPDLMSGKIDLGGDK